VPRFGELINNTWQNPMKLKTVKHYAVATLEYKIPKKKANYKCVIH
jgi:hypothetical protein